MKNLLSSRPGAREFFAAGFIALACLSLLLMGSHVGIANPQQAHALADNPSPPSQTVKLIFIHHSTGENWLDDGDGGLGIALRDNNYFVSDTNYSWGASSIGDTTDIGHWWDWFRGPSSATYLSALYAESSQHSSYSRLSTDPGGENEVVMFKSCFPNSHLGGNPGDPPTTGSNPLRGQDAWSEYMTVANAKGIYNDILEYFQTRQDKLFVVITAPPLVANDTDASHAANARAFNNWLLNDWLAGYPHNNVAVFDFYNVLTSNGGNTNTNDLGSATGNHHRWWSGAVQHIQTVDNDFSAYGSDAWDSHPTTAGNQKATGEFVPLLNVFYNNWKSGQTTATATPTTVTSTPTPTPTATRTPTSTPTPTPTGTPTDPPCVLDGDLDGDGDVDVYDIMLVANRWHTAEGDQDYAPLCDLDGNGRIDIVDIMLVAAHWGETCSTPTPTPTLSPPESCISSGDHTSIQNALTGPGSQAVLCPNAVFELSETVYFTADSQSIYTKGFPTDSTRAFLKVVGDSVATAVSAEGNDYVSLRNVIIDGNRPQLGLAEGALINFGRGVLDRDAEGHVVEWVKVYEPRGWTVIYLGGPCNGAVARNNEVGPAGRAEYIIADGISLDCANSVVENNTIIDVTDGGIVIFQSPGALVANNTIRAENRVMFYGISMEDYLPLEGDFTGTRVTGNVIDAAGAMIRRGIGMGPYVGCASEDENAPRSRGAVVTGNTLMGDHMAYGFVVSGVENWTVTGNVDLSTHLTPEREGDCFGSVVDPPAGFQYNPMTSSGTFQPEFEAAVLGGSTDMFPLYPVASETCMRDLIGAEVFEDIKAGNRGDLWSALESAPNGERIGQCISIYEPPDISDLSGNVAVELLPCAPFCAEVRLINLSDDTMDLGRAEFLLDDFLVPCVGLLDSLGPWEEAHCTIEDFVIPGSHGLRWFGFPPDGGFWVFDYPFE